MIALILVLFSSHCLAGRIAHSFPQESVLRADLNCKLSGCGSSTDDNQLCRITFQYRTRLDVEPVDDKGAVMAAMTVIPGICCAPGANEPVAIQALNGGRPF